VFIWKLSGEVEVERQVGLLQMVTVAVAVEVRLSLVGFIPPHH
jgi:hypothetical protein